MPWITDLDNGHKQDVRVLRKYFQQGMLTYRAKRMMKRAVEELNGRWEVKSVGLWVNTEQDSMAKVCGIETKEILERANDWAVSNPDPDWTNSNSLCPWSSFVALADAQARSQSAGGQNAATKEDIHLLRTWFKRGMLTGHCKKMMNHLRAQGHLNARFWTETRITDWVKLEKALITLYSGEEAAVLGIGLKWGINGHRNPNVAPESEWFSWDLEMRNYRSKEIRVKSEEPDGFTFRVPISLTTSVKMELAAGNKHNPTTSGLGFAKEPEMVGAREGAIRQEQLRQQKQKVREEEAHLAYLSQQAKIRREEGARQAWFREQERMRHEEEQKNIWLRDQERIRSGGAKILEQERLRVEGEVRQVDIRGQAKIREKEERQASIREGQRQAQLNGQVKFSQEEGLDALQRSLREQIRREKGKREATLCETEEREVYIHEEERLRHEHEEARLFEEANIPKHQQTVGAQTEGCQGEVGNLAGLVLGYEPAVNGLEKKVESRGEVAQSKVPKSQARDEGEIGLPVEKDEEAVRLLEEEATELRKVEEVAHMFTANVADFREGGGSRPCPNGNTLRLEDIGGTGTTMCSAEDSHGHVENLDAQRVHTMDTEREEANASGLRAPGTPNPTSELGIAARQVNEQGRHGTTARENAEAEIHTTGLEQSHHRQADDTPDDLVVFQSRPRGSTQASYVARDNIKKRPREAKDKQERALQQFLNRAKGLGLPGLSPSGNVTVNIFNVKRMKVKHLHADAPATSGSSG